MGTSKFNVVRRVAALVAVAFGLVILSAGTALGQSAEFMDVADQEELAFELAEASADQGICYGWELNLNNEGKRSQHVGSNAGAGTPVSEAGCEKYIAVVGQVEWTCGMCESYDSSSATLATNIAELEGKSPGDLGLDLRGLEDGSGDDVLYRAVAGLPAAAALHGAADFVSLEMNDSPLPEGAAVPSDGSDWLRQVWPLFFIPALLLLAAAGWGIAAATSSGRSSYGRSW